MISGFYTLKVVCEHRHLSPRIATFTGDTEFQARAAAERAGWALWDGYLERCPRHAKKGEPIPKVPEGGQLT